MSDFRTGTLILACVLIAGGSAHTQHTHGVSMRSDIG
jgi:hypothetical protein